MTKKNLINIAKGIMFIMLIILIIVGTITYFCSEGNKLDKIVSNLKTTIVIELIALVTVGCIIGAAYSFSKID